jgi:hypothetical protein
MDDAVSQQTDTEEPGPLPGYIAPVPITKSKSGITTEITRPSPLATKAIGDIKAAVAQDQQAADQGAAGVAEENEAAAAGHENMAEQIGRDSVDQKAQALQYEERLLAARQRKRELEDEARGMKFHDYFHDADGSRLVGRTVLSGLGLLFSGLSANPEAAHATVESMRAASNDDFTRQKQAFANKMDMAKAAGEDVDSLQREFNDGMARLSAMQKYANQKISEQALASAARASTPAQQAALRSAAAKFSLDAAKAEAELGAHLSAKTSVSTGNENDVMQRPQITPDQRENDAKAQRFVGVTKNADPLFKRGGLSPDARNAVSRLLTDDPKFTDRLFSGEWTTPSPNFFRGLSPQDAADAAAAIDLVREAVHAEGGAKQNVDGGAGGDKQAKERLVAALQQYVPLAGIDTPVTIARKRKNLETLGEGIANQSPRPAEWIGRLRSNDTPAASPGAQPRRPAGLPSKYTPVE